MSTQSCPLGWTTLEESQKLLEAGLSPDTADMWYGEVYEGFIDENGIYSKKSEPYYCIGLTKLSSSNVSINQIRDIPCWSTGALIELLPFEICIAGNKNLTYQLRFGKGKNEFWITYESQIADLKGAYIGFNTAIDKCDIADCVYKMVMFCLERGFIKKEEPCE
jgi:hypothetical protein